MNLLSVFMLSITITVALAQGWPNALREWVQSKVGELQVGQTTT